MTEARVSSFAPRPPSTWLTLIPYDREGNALGAIQVELNTFWYLNYQRLELVGPRALGNGKLAVQMCAGGQDYFFSGRDYRRLVHGARRISSEEAGIIEARLHQVMQATPSEIIFAARQLWCSRQAVPKASPREGQ